MRVLKYLENNPLENLVEEYAIKCKEYDNGLVVLNYDQINSPKFHPIVMECRGLIIDINSLSPVSRTFNRFFNLNENPKDVFDPDSLIRVEEKADGSLMSVYWHDNKWNVASRGNAYAEGKTATGLTFEEIFLNTIGKSLDVFMKDQFKNESYTFEMCSIHNKVVKFYEEPVVYLLNSTVLQTGKERDSDTLDHIAETLGVKRPILYNLEMDNIIKSFKDFPATEEGYVLIDKNGNRVKVKNPAYVNLHHLKGNGEITPKRITDVVFNGETEEVLKYFPEYENIFYPYQEAYDRMVRDIKYVFHELDQLNLDQKNYALKAITYPYSSILFSLRKGLTLDESFSKIGMSSKVEMLEKMIKK